MNDFSWGLFDLLLVGVAIYGAFFRRSSLKIRNTPKRSNNQMNISSDALLKDFENITAVAKNANTDVEVKAAKLKEFCKKWQLEQRLIDIYEEIQFYPSWSSRAYKGVYPGIVEPKERSLGKSKGIQFTYAESSFTLTSEGRSFDDLFWEIFHFYDSQDREIFTVRATKIIREWGTKYERPNVESFKVGSWIMDLVRLHVELKDFKQKRAVESQKESKERERKELGDKFGI